MIQQRQKLPPKFRIGRRLPFDEPSLAIARQLDGPPTEAMLRQAMAYGTALASYSVEEFGTERVERLTAGEIDARVEDLRGIGQFDHVPAPLEASLTTVAPPIET